MNTDHDRIATLEREHADVLRRVEMLSDEISHAIASMRLQSTQLVASAEAQRSLADGWQAARNHNEVLAQRLTRSESEAIKLHREVERLRAEVEHLRRAAVLDPSGEGEPRG